MLHWQYLVFLLTTVIHASESASGEPIVENIITFNNDLLNRLWNDRQILGNSTEFNYPVDSGTTTVCDRELYKKVFTEDLELKNNFTIWNPTWSLPQRSDRYYYKGYNFWETRPVRKVPKEIYSNLSCIHACITEKDFNCRSVVYSHGDGGVCSLYNVSGHYHADERHYYTQQETSDLWRIFKRQDEFRPCEVPKDEFAYPYFALGWKAMEAGWFTLANNQFDKAIDLDPDFYMAYVGKILSQPNLGYGLKHENGSSYADILAGFRNRLDWELKLGFQQQLIYKAVLALLKGVDMADGLEKMKQVFADDSTTVQDYMIKVLDANCLLLTSTPSNPNRLASQAKADKKVFALRFLTSNLNPYKEGRNRISHETKDAAIAAVYTFQELQIKGASYISADCIDIAEYYGEYNLAYDTVDTQRTFLFKEIAPNKLYKVVDGRIVMDIDGTNIDLIGVAQKVTTENEWFHFYQVQTLRLENAMRILSGIDEGTSDRNLRPIYRRMVANYYFSLYDFYNDKYASELSFLENLEDDFDNAVSPLDKVSYAYYWTAAAISDMRSSGNRKRRAVRDDTLTKITDLKKEDFGSDGYSKLVDIYEAILRGSDAFVQGDYTTALKQANIAGTLNDELINGTNFRIEGDDYSEQFRMLIPIGAQFKADMFRKIYFNAEDRLAEGTINAVAVTAAYREVTKIAPLNTTRALLGYADALIEENKNKPKREEEDTPEWILLYEALRDKRWSNNDLPEEEKKLINKVDHIVKDYYAAEAVGCKATQFQIHSKDDDGNTELCWGGYVIIGVCIAILVIIAIIVGILCLRRKAKAPARNKEKDEGFAFTGPNLNCNESGTVTPSYAMGSLSRDSNISDGPYMSQTLDMKRNLSNSDYTQRSNTLGAEKLYLNGGSYGGN